MEIIANKINELLKYIIKFTIIFA